MNDSPGSNFARDFGNVLRIAMAYSHPLEALFRTGFGARSTRRIPFGMAAILLHWIVLTEYGPKPHPALATCDGWIMFAFAMAYLGGAGSNNNIDPRQHSHYSGTPRLLGWLRRRGWNIDEVVCKRWIEPGIGLAAGFGIAFLHPALGTFLIFGSLSMAAIVNARDWQDREAAHDLRDAEVEQQLLQPPETKRPTAGGVAALPALRGQSRDEHLEAIHARLDPRLRELLGGTRKENDDGDRQERPR